MKKEKREIILNDKNNLPIGVFDSGIGGFTVLKELSKLLPNEKFVYVADSAFFPYGTKSGQEVERLVNRILDYFAQYPVKLIVIACNTASAYCFKSSINNIPIINCVTPTIEYALSFSNNILVLATKATIESKIYENNIEVRLTDDNSIQKYIEASMFVEICENNHKNSEESIETAVKNKLSCLNPNAIDVIILGCTHFGLLKKQIKGIFQNAILVDCGKPTAQKVYHFLKEQNLLRVICTDDEPHIKVFTTSAQEHFLEKIKWFDERISFSKTPIKL